MTTKKEYADALREALDTDIKFEQLTKEDIIKLTNMFAYPEILLEKLDIETESKKPLDRLVDLGKEWVERSPGPVASTLRELLGEDEERNNI